MAMTMFLVAAVAAQQVLAPAQTIASERIGDAVVHALVRRLGATHPDAQVRITGGLDDQRLPAGEVRIVVGNIAGRWPRQRIGVPVVLKVDGQPQRTLTIWAEVRDPRLVLTYAVGSSAHSSAGQLQVLPATVDMACCDGVPVAAAVELAGLRTRRAVRGGQPVLRGDFEPVPDVAAHEPVAIEVQRGHVRVTTVGQALRDANIGETVAVLPRDARQAVDAEVVATGKVAINE
jgi:flagella basal body P-ring formation protein FlgA